MSNFWKRTIFGTLYVAVVVLSMFLLRPYFFYLLFALFAVLAVGEHQHIHHSGLFERLSAMCLTAVLFFATMPSVLWLGLALYAVLLLICLVAELFLKAENPIAEWGTLLSGQVMVALPFAIMSLLFRQDPMLLLALFILIWTADTGAYCVGSLIGKHKLFPRVSPGKSWEGSIGGMLLTMLVGYLIFTDPAHLLGMAFPLWQALLFSFVIFLSGTLGDLMESLTKRTLGIKDSGNIIPGHGGMLDRFDSSLLAAPCFYLLLMLL